MPNSRPSSRQRLSVVVVAVVDCNTLAVEVDNILMIR